MGKALNSWKDKMPIDDLERVFEAHVNQGLLFQKLKAQDEGIKWYQQIAQENEKDWLVALQNRNIKPIKSNKRKSKTVDFNLGLVSYAKAEDMLQRFPIKEQNIRRIELLMGKGALFFEADQYNRAATSYEKAL